ncbi:MAG: lipoate--protein ligase family protein, partial [Chloroflexi bacterium]|nr:lipoate--protein ligase family protein [Chloroflexota bacterium]
VVDGSERVRDILVPVYGALGLDWDPDTTGSVRDEAPGVSYDDVQKAILDQFAKSYEVVGGSMPAEVIELAKIMEAEHRAP